MRGYARLLPRMGWLISMPVQFPTGEWFCVARLETGNQALEVDQTVLYHALEDCPLLARHAIDQYIQQDAHCRTVLD
jgi:hypothetical protein